MPTLQEQINTAISGATITLPDNSEHVGNFIVDKPITIQASSKAIVRTPNASRAINQVPKTGPVTLRRLEITTAPDRSLVYDIVGCGMWQTTSLADVPQGLTIEDCDIHGQPNQDVQRGVAADGANVTIKNTRIWDIHHSGADCQAIHSSNGPGPFKILDCYLEASGENVLFGGSDALIPNLVPSDIEIRRCEIVAPLSWNVYDPANFKPIFNQAVSWTTNPMPGLDENQTERHRPRYVDFRGNIAKHWKNKNRVELKHARRVIIDGCVIRHSWGDAQIGFGVLFTVRNQDGKNPWATVEDVVFTNNEVLDVAGGFQLIGKDYPNVSAQGARIRIANNFIRIAKGDPWGHNGRLLQLERTQDVTFENNDANPDHTFIVFAGDDPQPGLIYRRNVLTAGEYGITPAGLPPKDALTKYAPGHDFSENMIIAASDLSRLYPVSNTFVTSRPTVIPVGIGVNMEALKAAQGGTVTAPVTEPTPTPEPSPTPEPEPAPTPIATTSPDGTKATSITDDKGGVWTIGPKQETLRNGVHMANGFGSLYKWVELTVYVVGTDDRWWKWSGTGWGLFGSTEPGVTAPAEPTPVPSPTPTPTEPTPAPAPSISVIRKVAWPSGEAKQNAVVELQWKERYRFKRHLSGAYAEFEKVT